MTAPRTEPGISVEGVWKKFRRGERHDSLRDLLPSLARRFARGRGDHHLAVQIDLVEGLRVLQADVMAITGASIALSIGFWH